MIKPKRPSLSILIIRLALLAALLTSASISTPSAIAAQGSSGVLSPSEKAALQLAELTPQERVGQLFIVTFNGAQTSSPYPIHEFISKYHIGGVVLKRDNDNFPNPEQMRVIADDMLLGKVKVKTSGGFFSRETAARVYGGGAIGEWLWPDRFEWLTPDDKKRVLELFEE